ncbi:MAG TPA: PHB depolymerase family esterase [Noviherbaspirillum sp.]|nr:PHB depolymerase family esterase [Noviherbaspirillum sp.]
MSRNARLQARPSPVAASGRTGQQALDVGGQRDSYLYVPRQYQFARPAPMVLLLHGAGGHAHHGLGLLQHLADDLGMILVAPASAAHTWDVIASSAFGPDVAVLDRALAHVFSQYAVDASRLAIGGFSDGASYALSVGLANGDLFTHVIAFSPGFVASVSTEGAPRIFISHGSADNVLPVEPCSRRIVPLLSKAGYEVEYEEFAGGHEIPAEIAERAAAWFLRET